MTTLRDRYRGCLLGLATGDALGTTVEFSPPGSFTPLTDIVGGGPFSLPAGAWTDDTSMALCMAESFIERRGFDPVDQLERYVRWWRDGHLSSTGRCFDIGSTVRTALRQFEHTRQPCCGSSDADSAGNGSLMRLAPAVLAFASTPRQAIAVAAESSRTTHGAREAVDACRYFAALILGALQGASKKELLGPHFAVAPGALDEPPLAPRIAEIAGGSFRRREPPAIRGTGYVVACLEAALWAFHRSDGFREGALLAANLGDDADTTAAVYGQLAGAFYGESGIPQAWRDRIVTLDEITRFADGLFDLAYAHRWPAEPLPALSREDEDAYHRTWLWYDAADGQRWVVSPSAERAGAAAMPGVPHEFAVITACNPRSEQRPAAENDAANGRLRLEIEQRGGQARAIDARSPDGAWREPSFAVWAVPLGEIARLATAYGQNAFFVVADGRRTLGAGVRQPDPDRGEWLVVSSPPSDLA